MERQTQLWRRREAAQHVAQLAPDAQKHTFPVQVTLWHFTATQLTVPSEVLDIDQEMTAHIRHRNDLNDFNSDMVASATGAGFDFQISSHNNLK